MADSNNEPGNKNIFGQVPPIASGSRCDAIIDKTKTLAFPSGAVLSLENFEHYGDRPAGWMNSIGDMQELNGKALQESYRSGLSESAQYTDKVTDR
jgi:hypothetical protein